MFPATARSPHLLALVLIAEMGACAAIEPPVPEPPRVLRLVETGGSICALVSDGRVLCWARDGTEVPLEGDPTFVAGKELAAYIDYVCADDARTGAAQCFRARNGLEDIHRAIRVPDGVRDWQATSGTVCGLDSGGFVRCSFSEAGVAYGPANIQVARTVSRDAPTDGGWTELRVTDLQACARKDSGTFRCWGHGYSNFIDEPAPSDGVRAFDAWASYGVAIMADGSSRSWGLNAFEAPIGNYDAVELAANAACFRNAADKIWSCTRSVLADLPLFRTPPEPFESLVDMGARTCGIKPDGKLKCWALEGVATGVPEELR